VLFNADGGSLPPPVLVQVSGPALPKLIDALNALVPTSDEPPCPAPEQADVLVFASAGPPNTVRVDLQGGCQFVWSDTGVHAYATDALLQQLDAIVATAPGSTSPAATITATPAAIGLIGGERVQVTVTGFPAEAKVWLSECATAADVNPFGCGNQLAGMPFLMTDDTGSATGSFTVTADIPTAAEGGTTEACTSCVLAAVMGDTPDIPPTPTASTALAFAPTSGSPHSGT
jgi:hypothetical protein